MIPTNLAKLEQDLRRSAEARQYDDVQSLATAFCHAATAQIAALQPQDPERRRIANSIKDVLNWTLLMMLTARASCIDELSHVLIANRYLQQPAAVQERVHISL